MATTDAEVRDDNATLSHRRILLIYGALMLGVLLASLDETMVVVALPTIVDELGGLEYLALVVTAYILAATISAPVYGKLGDLYGRKPLFLVAIVVFVVGSALAGAAGDMRTLVAARVVQGLGAGGLIVGSQAITGDILPARRRARYQGYVAATFATASIAGPALGGLCVDQLSWRWIFYANLPLGALAFLAVAIVLPPSLRRESHHFDVLGIALLSAAVVPLVLALSLAGTADGWSSPGTWLVFALGAAMAVLFVGQERRAHEPIIPLRLLRNGVYSAATAAGFFVNLARWSAIIYVPVYLQVVLGASSTWSGVQLLPLLAAAVVSSFVSGRLITRSGRYKRLLVAGMVLMASGFFLLSRLGAEATSRFSRRG